MEVIHFVFCHSIYHIDIFLKMECSMIFFSRFCVFFFFVVLIFVLFWSANDLAMHWTWTKINLDAFKIKTIQSPYMKQKMDYKRTLLNRIRDLKWEWRVHVFKIGINFQWTNKRKITRSVFSFLIERFNWVKIKIQIRKHIILPQDELQFAKLSFVFDSNHEICVCKMEWKE